MAKKKTRYLVWFKDNPEPQDLSEKAVLYLIKQGYGHRIVRYMKNPEQTGSRTGSDGA